MMVFISNGKLHVSAYSGHHQVLTTIYIYIYMYIYRVAQKNVYTVYSSISLE